MKRWVIWVGLLWSVALPARAWTRAQVRDATVELKLRGDGRLEVLMALGVEVRGGRLERLELNGLDEGLALAAEPAWYENQHGLRGTPGAVASAGDVMLSFPREAELRQGVHRVGVNYDAPPQVSLGPTGQTTRVSWTFPGWEAGLDRVTLNWNLPAGSKFVPQSDGTQALTIEDGPNRRVLRLSREQLPRSSPWTITAEVPTPMPAFVGTTPGLRSGDRRAFAGVSTLVLLLAWLARAHVRRRAGALGLATRSPWGTTRLASWAACGLAVSALALSTTSVSGALVALVGVGLACLEIVQPAGGAPGLGHFEPIRKTDLMRLGREATRDWLGSAPWVDAGTAAGLGGALVWAGIALGYGGGFGGSTRPWALGLACGLVSWLTSARWRRPRSVAERVQRLLSAVSVLAVQHCATRIVWFVPGSGLASEPRLRVTTAARYHGLLRIEVVVDSRRGTSPLLLSVVATRDSGVDRALTARWGTEVRELSRGERRVVFFRPVAQLDEELNTLFETLSEHTQRSAQAMFEELPRAA